MPPMWTQLWLAVIIDSNRAINVSIITKRTKVYFRSQIESVALKEHNIRLTSQECLPLDSRSSQLTIDSKCRRRPTRCSPFDSILLITELLIVFLIALFVFMRSWVIVSLQCCQCCQCCHQNRCPNYKWPTARPHRHSDHSNSSLFSPTMSNAVKVIRLSFLIALFTTVLSTVAADSKITVNQRIMTCAKNEPGQAVFNFSVSQGTPTIQGIAVL